ncbi:ABC transporter ATP-binding protein [Alcaligenaceae bacterium CGII-47]|nr:ABC transporter ATP-binding protein [Alcaligenaceae bacterium CGII-47]
MSHIVITHLSKHYNAIPVLDHIELTIEHGCVLALLGPSGCGKTTLLRLIAGFERPDTGTIALDQRIVATGLTSLPPEKRGIGYVPQEGALFPHLNVEDNIRYGLRPHTHHQARVEEILALTNLQGLGKRFPHELSGGQQQRVALARALAPDPSLILLDEPFNALDLDLRRNMCEDVVSVLRRTGTTTVLVSHDPGEAFSVADQVAVMQGGVMMQCARPEQVYWQPASPAVARLTGTSIFMDGQCTEGTATCALGRLPLYPQCATVTGSALIMLRPEQVVPLPSTHQPKVHVSRSRFRGDHTLLDLELDGFCFSLRTSSLDAPTADSDISLKVHGRCMAFSSQE